VFAVALSCYDLDFDMSIKCVTFEGKLTDRTIGNETSTTDIFEGRILETKF
jgi:hypothetical protein